MNKWVYICLILLIVFSLGLSSCNTNTINKAVETVNSPALFTQWQSKTLASDMAFQQGIDAEY